MKIWQMSADVKNYDIFTFVHESDMWKIIDVKSFAGESMKEDWIPMEVEVLENIELGDIVGLLGHIPVFSSKAVLVLNELIPSSTELLPLKFTGGEYYFLNVLEVIDCIDHQHAKAEFF